MRRICKLFALVLLTACGGSGDPPGSPDAGSARADRPEDVAADTVQPRESVTPADGGTSAPTDTTPAGREDGWTSGSIERVGRGEGSATVSNLRIATHEGFDRIVLEMKEGWLPGYRISYETEPLMQCGSGFPIEITGERLLKIVLEPARAHTDEGVPTLTDRRWRAGLPVIRDAMLTCDFEGQVEIVADPGPRSRYRVLELSDPARLVIDVRRD